MNGLWEWLGHREKKGYGTFRWKDRKVKAHRASYELFREPIPDGMKVLHSCDNPPCVNPSHLFLGTSKDNNDDCNKKGRRNQYRKLSEELRDEIRYVYSGGDFTYEELAYIYQVSKSLIGNIVSNK